MLRQPTLIRQAARFLSKKPFYVTTPIFYVNASPHLGHLYSMLLADCRARWENLNPDKKTFFLTGTDEHGLKIQAVAEKQKIPPQELVDQVSQNFKGLAASMNIQYDRFIRTTDPDHVLAVTHFWKIMLEQGLIYKDVHSGWYSVSDEAFYPDSQIEQITDPKSGQKKTVSKETGSEVTYQEEENYFFKLLKFQDRLISYIEEHPRFIQPEPKRQQILEELKLEPLKDLSVSRHVSRLQWGIPVPDDPTQKVYVWFDALVNYITACGYPSPQFGNEDSFWPAHHVIGKDIMRFHCIYWPIFLMGAKIELPEMIFVHSHWLCEGKKMSKSIGNVVDPFEMAEYYGQEPLRFFLMEQSNILNDSNFSESGLHNHRAMLVNKFANLASRVCGPKFDVQAAVDRASKNQYENIDLSVLPDVQKAIAARDDLTEKINSLVSDMSKELDSFDHMKALRKWWGVVEQSNLFFADAEPWTLNKKVKKAETEEEKEKLLLARDYVVFLAAEGLRVASICAQPYMPDLANKALDMIRVGGDKRTLATCKVGGDLLYGESSNGPGKKILLERIEPRAET